MDLKSIVDCHTHSYYSDDSEMLPHDAINKVIDSGLLGLAFTDHLDLDYPNRDFNFTFDYAERSKFIDELRQKFNNRIKVLKGLELGYQPHIVAEAEKIVKNYDFDFVIASVHSVDRHALCSQASFYEGKDKEQADIRYLEEVYNSVVSMDCFDVVGHIGYIRRYSPWQDRTLKYSKYSDLIDAILKKVIEKGKGIELNTSGYYNESLLSPIPDFDIVKRYKELGGQILTLGSDSHDAKFIGYSFKPALERLKNVGFNFVTYFQARTPVFVKI